MKITQLITGLDNLSYFVDIETGYDTQEMLGNYSKHFPVGQMQFRDFEAGLTYDWHTAPQAQYIVYLSGEVQVETSSGEKRVFKSGDILFAADLRGKGHVTKTLSKGQSIVITAAQHSAF